MELETVSFSSSFEEAYSKGTVDVLQWGSSWRGLREGNDKRNDSLPVCYW